MRKKVALETKIRDAALNLQKLQTVKRLSKQTSEQVDAGNRKVDIATKELSRLLERASDVDRKLLEHRAGVLSFSVRNLESKLSPGNVIGESTDESTSISGGRITSQELNSPTSSVTSMSTRAKFDGAHLFAGHADTIIPGSSRKVANSAQVAALEEKLKSVEESLEAAEVKASEMQKQVKLLQLEKSDVEATLNLDLQTAEETVSKLEREMTEMENGDRDREAWDRERQSLEEDLKTRTSMVQQLERRVRELETARARGDTLERAMIAKDDEIRRLRDDAERERAQWERQRSQFEQEKREEIQQIRGGFGNLQVITGELDAGRDALRSVVRSHRVPTSPGDTSFPSIAASLGAYIATLDSKLVQSDREKSELEVLRRKYEEDVRNGFEIRERLGREVEEARREREESRKEVRLLENRIKVSKVKSLIA
jgi:Up-regulated During Septation